MCTGSWSAQEILKLKQMHSVSLAFMSHVLMGKRSDPGFFVFCSLFLKSWKHIPFLRSVPHVDLNVEDVLATGKQVSFDDVVPASRMNKAVVRKIWPVN